MEPVSDAFYLIFDGKYYIVHVYACCDLLVYLIFAYVWFNFFTPEPTIFQSCRYGSSWDEQVLSNEQRIKRLLKDTTQVLYRRLESVPQPLDPQRSTY